MANNPKKINDPTEAALSAIQDALSLREETPTSESKEASAPTVDGAAADHLPSEPPWRKGRARSPVNEEFDAEARTPVELGADAGASDEPGLLRRPANDDRESIGQILRALQRRPARTSYLIATVFAVAWVLAGLAFGWMYLPQLQASL